MIFRNEFLEKIKTGKVKIAFRRWTKISVKAGGTLNTTIGVLKFSKISIIEEKSLTSKDAKDAGFESLESLLKELNQRKVGEIYKICFLVVGPDPRLKLREKTKISDEDFENVFLKLERLDKASKAGPWTEKLLKVIKLNPGVGSKTLSEKMKMDQMKLKLNVRKLKNIGLTISLGTGYEISPRGEVILKKIKICQEE